MVRAWQRRRQFIEPLVRWNMGFSFSGMLLVGWETSDDAEPAEVSGIADADKRRALMRDVQEMLQSSGAIIQPFWTTLYLHHVAAVKGHERHQFREMHLEKVWLVA